MPFVVVGLSHKTAPLAVREKAFIPETGVGECVRRLIDHNVIDGGVMLSTCNRTELYAIAEGPDADGRVLRAFGWWPHELSFEDWHRYAYQLAEDDALQHLLRVAAGLDSMVIGEAQVLGQLKVALAQAQAVGAVDPALHIILRAALRTGKRVRQETDLGRRAVSVSHVAVAQAQARLGGLHGRRVLLVGSGLMGEVALRLFRNRGVTDLYVASRSLERARRLAQPLVAQALEMTELPDIIERVDIIVCSSAAPGFIIDQAAMRSIQQRREGRPLLIIDIAVPRNVDPGVGAIPGVTLLNIDDLRAVAEENLLERAAAIPAAEQIVTEELRRAQLALAARASAPLVTALIQRIETMRDHEVRYALARLPDADAATRQALQDLADRLTAKFLHGPIRHLRESADPRLEGAVFADAFRLSGDAKDD